MEKAQFVGTIFEKMDTLKSCLHVAAYRIKNIAAEKGAQFAAEKVHWMLTSMRALYTLAGAACLPAHVVAA
eukprot:5504564-Lingulodinium_polyedra.AAC.1